MNITKFHSNYTDISKYLLCHEVKHLYIIALKKIEKMKETI